MEKNSVILQEVPSNIEVLEGDLAIRNFYVHRREVADHFRGIENEARAAVLADAIEVGVFCLERARVVQDFEFVRRQIDSLLAQVERATESIPEVLEEELLLRLGTQDGQALAPVRILVEEVKRGLGERLQEVRGLLADEIDPANDSSKLGMAIRTITAMLDPNYRNSVQSVLQESVSKLVGEDGSLAKTVKTTVHEAVRPLADEVNRLAGQIQASDAANEVIERTIAKGTAFEDKMLRDIQHWCRHTGVEISHVGGDNQPGDILLASRDGSLTGVDLSIVIEVRNRSDAAGRRRISEDIGRAMVQRKAQAGIYLSKSGAGFGAEIGDWAEGVCEAGPFIATTSQHVINAIRYLIVSRRLSMERTALPNVDVEAVEGQIQRIRTAIDRTIETSRNISTAKKALEGIRAESDAMREDVRDALARIEETLRSDRNGSRLREAKLGGEPQKQTRQNRL